MTGRLALWLALGLLLASAAAACGSAPPSPTIAPTPVSSWDPRRDEIDQAQGIWETEHPGTYAYTSTTSVDGMGSASSRVAGMDGHTEVLVLAANGFVSSDGATVEALFDVARASLDGSGTLRVAIDQRYGYPSSLAYTTDAADGSFTRTVTEFTTPGDRSAGARAREALDQALTRWNDLATPAWEYTWTRIDAAAAGTPTSWVVRHAGGETSARAAGTTIDRAPPDQVTINGTVGDAVGVMASGGWVDVSTDSATGLDMLLAIDPSPGIKGDGYWIRVDFTDRAAEQQRKALAAAKERWAAAAPKKYAYTWAYDGEKGAWSWTMAMNGETGKVTKKSASAPPVEGAFAPPRIPETFELIGQVLDAGGTVSVTYDKTLGYPRKIVFANATEWAPRGTVTITDFKTR